MRERKTRDEWQIWGKYAGTPFECECCADSRREARQLLREYRENGGGIYQLRKARIRIEAPPTVEPRMLALV